MRIAIHQPNYLPWMGYFYKMTQAEFCILLDDAQFPKNSYTNRSRILTDSGPRWLTVPVKVSLGMAINEVSSNDPAWMDKHLDTLKWYYGKASYFRETFDDLSEAYSGLPGMNLSDANIVLIRWIFSRLDIQARIEVSSALGASATRGEARLVELIQSVSTTATYIHGQGGANYQTEELFAAHDIKLHESGFSSPPYEQNNSEFVPGLSIIDAAFHVGWEAVREMVHASKND